MNLERRTWYIARLLVILLMLVSLRAAYWQLIRGLTLEPVVLDPVEAAREYARLRGGPTPAPDQPEQLSLVQLPQPVIQRTVQMLSTIQRGAIYDRDGNILAQDTGQMGNFTRIYTDPSVAHTVGYASAIRAGVSGLEATYNRELLGLNRADTEIDRMLHRSVQGSSLVLTIDSQVQQTAVQALGGRAGAVLALDAKTGAILAMVSQPTFDPNRINEPEYMASLQGTTALINRVTQALYTPGSIYKTITLIAALDSGHVDERAIFEFGEPRKDEGGRTYYVYNVEGFEIRSRHDANRLDLPTAYMLSANGVFAKLADEMGGDTFIEYNQRLGFSTDNYAGRFPFELVVSAPQLANDIDDIHNNRVLRASTGFGQGELLTTPLNMAMVVEAVLNDGSIPVPYLVESIRDPEGNVIRTRPEKHTVRGVISRETARKVKEIMIFMVENGIRGELVPNAVSGGKTGTAQQGGELEPHAWFIGFAERGERSVVVVVVGESAGSGGQIALPIFAQVANAALEE